VGLNEKGIRQRKDSGKKKDVTSLCRRSMEEEKDKVNSLIDLNAEQLKSISMIYIQASGTEAGIRDRSEERGVL
jgi:hypothetical protein